MKDALNPFKIAQQQLDDAARRLELDPAMHELLRWPMQELNLGLPTTPHAVLQKAVYGGILMKPLTQFGPWQRG